MPVTMPPTPPDRAIRSGLGAEARHDAGQHTQRVAHDEDRRAEAQGEPAAGQLQPPVFGSQAHRAARADSPAERQDHQQRRGAAGEGETWLERLCDAGRDVARPTKAGRRAALAAWFAAASRASPATAEQHERRPTTGCPRRSGRRMASPTIAGTIAGHRCCAERLAFFANCRDHRFTMRETPFLRSIPRQFPWVLGLAIVMAVTGPFGIYGSVGLGVRLVYFGATGVLTAAGLGGALLLSQVEAFQRWSIAARMALAGCSRSYRGPSRSSSCMAGWCGRRRFAPRWSIYPQTAFLTVVVSVMIGLLSSNACAPLPTTNGRGVSGYLRARSRRMPLPTSSAACRPRSAAIFWPWKWRTITCASPPRSAAT